MTGRKDRSRKENPPHSTKDTGLPAEGEPVFLVVGRLRRPHGLEGEVMLDVITDFPERVEPGVTLYVGQDFDPLKIQSVREFKGGLLIAFEGYETPEEIGELRSELVYVSAEDRPPLPEGEYYHHQMIGLRVVVETGEEVGILSHILDTGANDVYIVHPENGPDILLPATEEVILDVDLKKGEMRVHILPGLLPE